MREIQVKQTKIQVNYFDQSFTHLECNQIRTEIRQTKNKPEILELMGLLSKKELLRTHDIIDYYTRPLLRDTTTSTRPLSFNECLDSDDYLRSIKGEINADLYGIQSKGKTKKLSQQFKQFMSLRGSHMKVAGSYPFRSVVQVLEDHKHSKNPVYYDYSCGWGNRLLGGLVSGYTYLGTDPNHLLTKKLEELGNDYVKVNGGNFDIKTQGSEILVQEWVDKVDIAFSSPPYFDLEDYQHGDQSIKDRSYEEWLQEYWDVTVKNIKKYLKKDGIFLLNIKNIKGYNLLDDMASIIIKNEFKYQYSDEVVISSRPGLSRGKASEEILVFALDDYIQSDATKKRLKENKENRERIELEDSLSPDELTEYKDRLKQIEEEYWTQQMVTNEDFKKTTQRLNKKAKPKVMGVKVVPPSKRKPPDLLTEW